MNTLSNTTRPFTSVREPGQPGQRVLQGIMLRWWLRLCQQAERKTRVVPRY